MKSETAIKKPKDSNKPWAVLRISEGKSGEKTKRIVTRFRTYHDAWCYANILTQNQTNIVEGFEFSVQFLSNKPPSHAN